jgi:hypothetical protein
VFAKQPAASSADCGKLAEQRRHDALCSSCVASLSRSRLMKQDQCNSTTVPER